MYGRNLRAYQKTTVNAEISVADPYYVTKLLYQGLFERLAQAKGAIERGDLALKAKNYLLLLLFWKFEKHSRLFSKQDYCTRAL